MTAVRRTGSIDALEDAEEFEDDEPLDERVEQEGDELERIADAALEQLAFREEYLGDDYPFALNGALKAKPGAANTVYGFLVAVTSVGWRNEAAPESAASLFELVSRRSARQLSRRHTGRPVVRLWLPSAQRTEGVL